MVREYNIERNRAELEIHVHDSYPFDELAKSLNMLMKRALESSCGESLRTKVTEED
jgi:hypothetical protein